MSLPCKLRQGRVQGHWPAGEDQPPKRQTSGVEDLRHVAVRRLDRGLVGTSRVGDPGQDDLLRRDDREAVMPASKVVHRAMYGGPRDVQCVNG
jgi:hypothetical protein